MAKGKKGNKTTAEVADIQTTLFAVPADSKEGPTFVRLNEQVLIAGDEYSFVLDSATYNADKACLTAFDGDGNAIGVHMEHSDALRAHADEQGYTLGDSDGIKFGRAIFAANLLVGTTATTIEGSMLNVAQAINDNENVTLWVRGIETRAGHMARVWSVSC